MGQSATEHLLGNCSSKPVVLPDASQPVIPGTLGLSLVTQMELTSRCSEAALVVLLSLL